MTEAALATVLMVFGRLSGLLYALPVISTHGVPRYVPLMFALGITWLVAPHVPMAEAPVTLMALGAAVAFELGLGFMLAGIMSAMFSSLSFAADVMSMQMGLSMAASLDPLTKTSSGVIGRLSMWLATLVFLESGMHLDCILLIGYSFEIVAPGGAALPWGELTHLVGLAGHLFSLGVQLAAPVIVLLSLVNAFVAVLAKLAPRMNVFFSLGLTLNSVLGLCMFGVALDWMLIAHVEAMQMAFTWMEDILQAMR